MTMDPLSDEKIVDSWHRNAVPWTSAVREKKIASRNLVTNKAIVDAVLSRTPRNVLDIGCGEGWLLRALAEHGVRGIGVDVVPALIEQAQRAGVGDYRVASFEQIGSEGLDVTVDVAVANFSLIGNEAVASMLRRVPSMLAPGGALIIQTMHPVIASHDVPYQDGWLEGSWAGFSDDFSDPAPWYFRTMESWVRLLDQCGMRLCELREPLHPETRRPASVIFIAEVAQQGG